MRTISPIRTILLIIGTALLFVMATALLPLNSYQRYNQFTGTIYGNLGWMYERMHFDPTPIDVAVIGSSRTMLAISGPRLQADLAARGVEANVVNFSIVGNGRNIEAMIVNELLATKKPKLIIVEAMERRYKYGHPAFAYAAPTHEILTQPLGLQNQPMNLLYLPYRNARLFMASLLPSNFDMPTQFDPAKYRGSNPETTHSFMLIPGRWIEMEQRLSPGTLLSGARDNEARTTRPSRLPAPIANHLHGDEIAYTQRIVDAARAHGTKVAFVYIPYYSGPAAIGERDFYAARGARHEAGFLADQDAMYQGWAHLNRKGAEVMTDWLSERIAPLLGEK